MKAQKGISLTQVYDVWYKKKNTYYRQDPPLLWKELDHALYRLGWCDGVITEYLDQSIDNFGLFVDYIKDYLEYRIK